MDLIMEEKPRPDGSWTVSLSGRLNGASAPLFKNYIIDMVDAGKKKLVIDMGDLVFIDSSGLSALISGLKCAREPGGWLKLTGLRDQPLSVIKLMLLDRIFEILPEADSASPNV